MAKASVRDLWKAKIEGKLQSKKADIAPPPLRRAFSGTILGVDPSLRGTGLALLEFARGRQPLLLHSMTLRIKPSASFAFCLGEIHTAVARALNEHGVDHIAVEQTIYVQNFQTAQILGAARGAAISAAAVAGKPVFEYPPLRVKQAVVGVGRASKEQVARTVMGMLGHGRTLDLDEADAAAVALCHAMTWHG